MDCSRHSQIVWTFRFPDCFFVGSFLLWRARACWPTGSYASGLFLSFIWILKKKESTLTHFFSFLHITTKLKTRSWYGVLVNFPHSSSILRGFFSIQFSSLAGPYIDDISVSNLHHLNRRSENPYWSTILLGFFFEYFDLWPYSNILNTILNTCWAHMF